MGTSRLPVRHPVAWLRANPGHADALLGVCLAVFGVAGELVYDSVVAVGFDMRTADAWSILLSAVTGLAVVRRREHPVLALTIVGPLTAIHSLLRYMSPGPIIATVVALYSVAAYADARAAKRALAVTAVALAALVVAYRHEMTVIDLIANVAVLVVPWILGDNLRNRRALLDEVQERAALAELDRAAQAEQAVHEERGRIARELHDVVAHAMGVMVVQAGAARRVLTNRPDAAEEALRAVEVTGRQALDEMRRVVGVLRDGGGLTPQPTLARVEDLVDEHRAAGLPVELTVSGERRQLPPGVELSAFRIVQEALTNVHLHAGPARVRVALGYGADAVTVEVTDDGRGAAAAMASSSGGGHGLVGMRERVELFGGELRAGPHPGGGYEVRASLPLHHPDRTAGPRP